MTYVLVIHTVEDYAKWKIVFDEHGTIRKAKGSKGASILSNTTVPDQIVIITEWEDMEAAKNFAEAEDLKIAMQKAGVVGIPAVYYLEEIERTQY
jgi:heme-degrading monooxygenase HmoA